MDQILYSCIQRYRSDILNVYISRGKYGISGINNKSLQYIYQTIFQSEDLEQHFQHEIIDKPRISKEIILGGHWLIDDINYRVARRLKQEYSWIKPGKYVRDCKRMVVGVDSYTRQQQRILEIPNNDQLLQKLYYEEQCNTNWTDLDELFNFHFNSYSELFDELDGGFHLASKDDLRIVPGVFIATDSTGKGTVIFDFRFHNNEYGLGYIVYGFHFVPTV